MIQILFAAIKYPYANKDLGISYEYYHFLDSLKQMDGIEVTTFDWVGISQRYGKDHMNEQLVKKVKKEKPDLVFFSLFRNEFSPACLSEIKHYSTTYNWFCDDLWRFEDHVVKYAPHFSWISTTWSEMIPRYQSLGLTNVVKTQFGVNEKVFKKQNFSEKWHVSFVGQMHSNRRRFLHELISQGIPVYARGKGTTQGPVSLSEMVEIFNRSVINLNFTTTSFAYKWGRFLPWFVQPLRIYSKKDIHIINGRLFEIPSCGGFMLTDYSKGLEDYFVPQKEIVVYNGIEDLISKANYYLKHEDERKQIAYAGHKRVLRDHTYKKRFKKIFYEIGLF